MVSCDEDRSPSTHAIHISSLKNNIARTMADVPAVDAVPAPAPSTPEIDQIRQMLEWIGFTDAAQCESIVYDAFSSYGKFWH